MKCKSCGAKLDLTMSNCPVCGNDVPMARLTGLLGIVCRHCDAYNEPDAKVCIACGKSLGRSSGDAQPAAAEPSTRKAIPSPAPAVEPARKAIPSPAPAVEPARKAIPSPTPAVEPARKAIPSPAPAAELSARKAVPSPAPAAAPPPAPAAPAPIPLTAAVAEPGAAAPAPVIHSFPKQNLAAHAPAAAQAPARAAPIPLVQPSPPVLQPAAPAPAPIPLVPRCPSCGQEAGAGPVCAHCGQAMGAHGTQVMAPVAPPPKLAPASAQPQPGRATLVLERGEGSPGAVFRLEAEQVAAGRSQGSVLFPSDPCLAPLHATFFHRGGALWVRDEGGQSGTFLQIRGQVPLRPGDLFALGDRLLRFAGPLPAPPLPPPDGTLRLGSPRPQGPSILIEEWLEGGAGGRVYLRAGPAVTIGRVGCSINLGDDPLLSQTHAEIAVEPDGTFRIRDAGSSNGTFLRMPSQGERELQAGDLLRLGREVLRVALG